MTMPQQLRLVNTPAPAHNLTTDPVRRVFEHWVFMFGRCAKRTKLDHERRLAIAAALAMYDQDVETIMQAVEGMAAVPLGDKPQSMRDAMIEVSWFLAKAARIERALRYADDLRAMAARSDAAALRVASGPGLDVAPADPAAAAAARDKLRALAEQCRGARG